MHGPLTPAAATSRRVDVALDATFYVAAAALALLVVVLGPLATNDGPVHVSFARLLATLGTPDHPVQSAVYERNDAPPTNAAVYAVLGLLLRFVRPGTAELIVQLTCVVGTALAARFAVRQVDPRNRWLAILVLPFVLNQTFFWGLYNFAWSVAAFFVAAGACVRYAREPRVRWAALSGAALLLAIVAHVGGFVAAVAFVLGYAAWSVLAPWIAEGRVPRARVVRAAALTVAAAPSLVLFGRFLAAAGRHETVYGVPIASRLFALATLNSLSNNAFGDRWAVLVLQVALVAVAGFAIVGLVRRAWRERWRVLDGAAGTLVVLWLGFVALALAFPDTSGGGWTHFQRVLAFPSFALVLLAATARFPPRAAVAASAAGVAVLAYLLAATAFVQHATLRQRDAILAFAPLIGRHCTVLPLVMQPRPLWRGDALALSYRPLYHAGTLLEWDDDRVSLFSYLARLDNYPVRYRAGHDAQALLFRWPAGRQDNEFYYADVNGFERTTGLPVDYVVVYGETATWPRSLRVMHSVVDGRFERVTAPGEGAQLWRRLGPPGASRCTSRTPGAAVARRAD